jgi:hypothetical protein
MKEIESEYNKEIKKIEDEAKRRKSPNKVP